MPDIDSMIDCNYHLGDDPGFFPDSPYVGLTLRLPVRIPKLSEFSGPLYLIIETSAMETLGGAKHQVFLGHIEVGRLTDGPQGPSEKFEFEISREIVQSIEESMKPVTLTIAVDHLGNHMSDDFVVNRYGTRAVAV